MKRWVFLLCLGTLIPMNVAGLQETGEVVEDDEDVDYAGDVDDGIDDQRTTRSPNATDMEIDPWLARRAGPQKRGKQRIWQTIRREVRDMKNMLPTLAGNISYMEHDVKDMSRSYLTMIGNVRVIKGEMMMIKRLVHIIWQNMTDARRDHKRMDMTLSWVMNNVTVVIDSVSKTSNRITDMSGTYESLTQKLQDTMDYIRDMTGFGPTLKNINAEFRHVKTTLEDNSRLVGDSMKNLAMVIFRSEVMLQEVLGNLSRLFPRKEQEILAELAEISSAIAGYTKLTALISNHFEDLSNNVLQGTHRLDEVRIVLDKLGDHIDMVGDRISYNINYNVSRVQQSVLQVDQKVILIGANLVNMHEQLASIEKNMSHIVGTPCESPSTNLQSVHQGIDRVDAHVGTVGRHIISNVSRIKSDLDEMKIQLKDIRDVIAAKCEAPCEIPPDCITPMPDMSPNITHPTPGYPPTHPYPGPTPGHPPRPSYPSITTPGYPPSPSYPAPTIPGYPTSPSYPVVTTVGYPPTPSYPIITTVGYPPTSSYPVITTAGYPPTTSYPATTVPGYPPGHPHPAPTVPGYPPGYPHPSPTQPGYPPGLPHPGPGEPGYPPGHPHPGPGEPGYPPGYPHPGPGEPTYPPGHPHPGPGGPGHPPGYPHPGPGEPGYPPGYPHPGPGEPGYPPGYPHPGPGEPGYPPGYPHPGPGEPGYPPGHPRPGPGEPGYPPGHPRPGPGEPGYPPGYPHPGPGEPGYPPGYPHPDPGEPGYPPGYPHPSPGEPGYPPGYPRPGPGEPGYPPGHPRPGPGEPGYPPGYPHPGPGEPGSPPGYPHPGPVAPGYPTTTETPIHPRPAVTPHPVPGYPTTTMYPSTTTVWVHHPSTILSTLPTVYPPQTTTVLYPPIYPSTTIYPPTTYSSTTYYPPTSHYPPTTEYPLPPLPPGSPGATDPGSVDQRPPGPQVTIPPDTPWTGPGVLPPGPHGPGLPIGCDDEATGICACSCPCDCTCPTTKYPLPPSPVTKYHYPLDIPGACQCICECPCAATSSNENSVPPKGRPAERPKSACNEKCIVDLTREVHNIRQELEDTKRTVSLEHKRTKDVLTDEFNRRFVGLSTEIGQMINGTMGVYQEAYNMTLALQELKTTMLNEINKTSRKLLKASKDIVKALFDLSLGNPNMLSNADTSHFGPGHPGFYPPGQQHPWAQQPWQTTTRRSKKPSKKPSAWWENKFSWMDPSRRQYNGTSPSNTTTEISEVTAPARRMLPHNIPENIYRKSSSKKRKKKKKKKSKKDCVTTEKQLEGGARSARLYTPKNILYPGDSVDYDDYRNFEQDGNGYEIDIEPRRLMEEPPTKLGDNLGVLESPINPFAFHNMLQKHINNQLSTALQPGPVNRGKGKQRLYDRWRDQNRHRYQMSGPLFPVFPGFNFIPPSIGLVPPIPPIPPIALPNPPRIIPPGLPRLPPLLPMPGIPPIPSIPEIFSSLPQKIDGSPYSVSYNDGKGNSWNVNVNRRSNGVAASQSDVPKISHDEDKHKETEESQEDEKDEKEKSAADNESGEEEEKHKSEEESEVSHESEITRTK